ncbi:lysine methyltransferase domain-containing protein [Ditylenchus destructor]|nr:lysine methyltransferase domain-containing protein [Ditylenchus destructor]
MNTDNLWKHSWPSSTILSEFIASNKHLWEGKVILELGAGATALPSLTVLRCGAKEAWITEQCHLQKYIERNINRNFLDAVDKSRAKIVGLNWGCDESIQQFLNQTTQLDFIFGSDVFFDPCVFSPLIKTIRRLLDKFPQAEFYFAYQIRDSDWNIEDLLLLNNLKSSFISQVDTDKHSIQLGKIFASLPIRHKNFWVKRMCIFLPWLSSLEQKSAVFSSEVALDSVKTPMAHPADSAPALNVPENTSKLPVIAGVEGGATKSTLVFLDSSGKKLGQWDGSALNCLLNGIEWTADRIAEWVRTSAKELNIQLPIDSLVGFHCSK